jgi:hypothetical protein
MKVTGRGKIEKTKGETVGLQSQEDECTLELNGRILCEESVFPRNFVTGFICRNGPNLPHEYWRKI